MKSENLILKKNSPHIWFDCSLVCLFEFDCCIQWARVALFDIFKQLCNDKNNKHYLINNNNDRLHLWVYNITVYNLRVTYFLSAYYFENHNTMSVVVVLSWFSCHNDLVFFSCYICVASRIYLHICVTHFT